MIPPIAVHCGFGGLLAALSIPLVLRKVPMNRAYGIRLPKAFSSESNWYEINAYGGRLLFVYGVALCIFGVLVRDSAPPPASLWTAVFTIGPLALVFPILALINAHARRLP
jgi:uncharacterized membrane protein